MKIVPEDSLAAPRVTIVIPVYNEALMLREAVTGLCAKLDERAMDYELIVAENGSRDATREILAELTKELPRLRALSVGEPNYGRALREGIFLARGRVVVCDEIDLCDVDFYERAVPLIESGEAELVVGSKLLSGARDERPLFRHMASMGINFLLRVFLGFRGTDTHGLKCFNREALVPVAKRCVVEKDLFASEFVIRAGRGGVKVREIPVRTHEKRPPSIHLMKRVPNVLKNLARLVWVIRIRSR